MKKWCLIVFAVLGIIVVALGCTPLVQVQTIGLPAASSVGPSVGLVLDKNLTVVDVVPGSGAEQAGVMKGDVLKALNYASITPETAARALRRLDNSKKVALTLVRGNEELTLNVHPVPVSGRVGAPSGMPPPTGTPVAPDMLYF